MASRSNEPIETWESGDTIRAYLLLSRKEERQDRNGRKYLDMQVTDATGSMAAKVWADSPAMQSEFETHDFVAVKGSVKLYREALQLSVDNCRRVSEEDRAHGFDETKLIPSTDEDLDDLWRRLNAIYPGKIERPVLRRLAEETLAEHGEALRLHPAAKTMHHAYLGGLIEHVVSMAELALGVCGHYRDIDRDLVLIGVLFHDLGKLREIGAMPANDYTMEGRLVGHTVIGRDLVLARCAAIPDFPPDLQLLLEHLVLSHQGKKEYSAPVEPMTSEAIVLHFIDDLDAKLNQLHNHRKQGGGMQFLRGLGRFIYLDPVPKDEPAPAPSSKVETQIETQVETQVETAPSQDEARTEAQDEDQPQSSLFASPPSD